MEHSYSPSFNLYNVGMDAYHAGGHDINPYAGGGFNLLSNNDGSLGSYPLDDTFGDNAGFVSLDNPSQSGNNDLFHNSVGPGDDDGDDSTSNAVDYSLGLPFSATGPDGLSADHGGFGT